MHSNLIAYVSINYFDISIPPTEIVKELVQSEQSIARGEDALNVFDR